MVLHCKQNTSARTRLHLGYNASPVFIVHVKVKLCVLYGMISISNSVIKLWLAMEIEDQAVQQLVRLERYIVSNNCITRSKCW